MFTKYSDASNVEKTANKRISSSNDLGECCKAITEQSTVEGNTTCPGCGNDIFMSISFGGGN